MKRDIENINIHVKYKKRKKNQEIFLKMLI